MRKLCIIILGFLLVACNGDNESGLSFTLNNEILKFMPDGDSILYTSAVGDSVYLRQDFYQAATNRSDEVTDLGSLGEADFIETQSVRAAFSLDTLNFDFNFENRYTGGEGIPTTDFLTVIYSDNQRELSRLELNRKDSINCLSACNFADTLALDSVNFLNLYFGDTSQSENFYINKSEGLAAFEVAHKLYKRAD